MSATICRLAHSSSDTDAHSSRLHSRNAPHPRFANIGYEVGHGRVERVRRHTCRYESDRSSMFSGEPSPAQKDLSSIGVLEAAQERHGGRGGHKSHPRLGQPEGTVDRHHGQI